MTGGSWYMPTIPYEPPTSLYKYVNNFPNEQAVIVQKEYLPGEGHAGFIGGIRNAPHYAQEDFQGIADIVRQMVRGAGGLFLLEHNFKEDGLYFERHRLYAEAEHPFKVYAELLFTQSKKEPKYVCSAHLYLKFQEDGEQLFKSVAGLLQHVSYLHTPGGGKGYSVSFK